MPHRSESVILIEPQINAITQRFGLPLVACYPPLTQARLAAQIHGGGAEIADLRIPGERARLLERVRRDPPLLVGISLTFTSNGDEAIELASAIRRASPGTAIVLGGTAPSEDPDSFHRTDADLIAHRAADASLAALVAESRASGRVPDRFPGFYHREADRWVLDQGPPAVSMASLRPYAWHLVPRRYWRHYWQGFRATGIGQTSEGCPFDCTFCSVWITHGRKVSLAALPNVQHDFRSLPGFVSGFFFADDIWLQASEAQIRELYDPLLDWLATEFLPGRNADFRMTVETRTDLYLRQEDRFKDWIARGALKWILFGVEGATDEQLDAYSKRNSVDANSEAIRRASEAGALITAQFVVPCEAERRDFDEIVRFVREHRRWIRTANFTVATPLPGTVLYRKMSELDPDLADRGIVSHPAFSLFTALTPMRLHAVEFYEQMARLYREANQVRISRDGVRQLLNAALRSPWLLGKVARMPVTLRRLTNARTYIEAHRETQADRLMGLDARHGPPAGGTASPESGGARTRDSRQESFEPSVLH